MSLESLRLWTDAIACERRFAAGWGDEQVRFSFFKHKCALRRPLRRMGWPCS